MSPPSLSVRFPLAVLLLWAGLLALVGMGLATLPGTAAPPASASIFAPDGLAAPGVVLVGLRDGASRVGIREATPQELARLPELIGLPLIRAERLALAGDGVLELRLQVPSGQEETVLRALRQDPRVVFAEPDWFVHASQVNGLSSPPAVLPNDPLFRTYQWGMQRIHTPRAWALSLGSPIQVAVVDSGMDLAHPEFQGRILAGKDYVEPGTSPQDDSGHGTHVAGIIGAALNNGLGVAGVAPQVRFDPRKVLNAANAGTVSNVALAIREATAAGARIINLSLESPQPSSVLESAVNEAWNAGVLVVASAGNVGQPPGAPTSDGVLWPAAYSVVIAVGATDRFDNPAGYSRKGAALDLVAPGGTANDLIISTWPAGVACSTPPPGITGGYCGAQGTSMSAAFVSGVAALVWGYRPDLTRDQVISILYATARKLSAPTNQVGQGRVDAQAGLRRAIPPELRLEPNAPVFLALHGETTAFARNLTLTNPSSEPLTWQAQVISGSNWLSLGEPVSGTVRYGLPASLTAVIAPATLDKGTYRGTIRTTAQRTTGSQVVTDWPVTLLVSDPLSRTAHLPLVTVRGAGGPGWQTPDPGSREVYSLTDSSSVGVALPFTYTLEGRPYTTLRIYADGFVTFPATHTVDSSQPVTCLPEDSPAHRAIYAWWADLDPRRGGQISTFRVGSDLFGVEFQNVASGAGVSPGYTVSFQILLRPDGRVHLVYGQVPAAADPVTVGMEIQDSLLYTQIACWRSGERYGSLPISGGQFTILPTDLR